MGIYVKFNKNKTYFITTTNNRGVTLRYRCKYMDEDLYNSMVRKYSQYIDDIENGFGNSGIYISVDFRVYKEIQSYIQHYYETKEINTPSSNNMDIISSTNQEILDWVERLSRLAGIDKVTALEIAHGRIKFHKIRLAFQKLKRQNTYHNNENFKKAQALVRKYINYSPLYDIKDKQTARDIYDNYFRHVKTDYEKLLQMYRELANQGKIDPKEVKRLAMAKANVVNENYLRLICSRLVKNIINEKLQRQRIINETIRKITTKYLK